MRRYRHQRKQTNAVAILFIIAGAILCFFTVINLIAGNQNLGVWLPAILGIPLLVYGIFKPGFDRFFATRVGHIIKWIVIVLYLLACAVLAISCAMMANAAMKEPDPGADAVLVLGAAVHGDEVTDTLEKRLNKAIEYYEDNPDSIIVVSGGMGNNENVTEAEAMQKYLVSEGIPAASILMEDEATSTKENFENTKRLLDDHFGTDDYRLVYVTNDFHILRAGMEARKAGMHAVQGLGAPTPILTIPGAYMRESAALLYSFARGDFSGENLGF